MKPAPGRPYMGDFSEPTNDYLLWVATRVNPRDPEAGLKEAVAQFRKDYDMPDPTVQKDSHGLHD